mmetsp:Transcript_33251/g.56907  ORF Transcript_33251/g.56907 Transcript_33251/m.56907 type:complete len:234 (+) Transcript_33251:618-1319(+)
MDVWILRRLFCLLLLSPQLIRQPVHSHVNPIGIIIIRQRLTAERLLVLELHLLSPRIHCDGIKQLESKSGGGGRGGVRKLLEENNVRPGTIVSADRLSAQRMNAAFVEPLVDVCIECIQSFRRIQQHCVSNVDGLGWVRILLCIHSSGAMSEGHGSVIKRCRIDGQKNLAVHHHHPTDGTLGRVAVPVRYDVIEHFPTEKLELAGGAVHRASDSVQEAMVLVDVGHEIVRVKS